VLVTNDHVVSGVNLESRRPRERDRIWLGWAEDGNRRPNRIRVHLPTPDIEAPDALFEDLNPASIDLDLYDNDDLGKTNSGRQFHQPTGTS
jgi:hypothetical protein